MSGFNELIPQELINVFDERELELLIGGIGEVDCDDWARHTDYRVRFASSSLIDHSAEFCGSTVIHANRSGHPVVLASGQIMAG